MLAIDGGLQGFATGDLEGDAHAIRLFADAGLEFLLAQSYAKNMGAIVCPLQCLNVFAVERGMGVFE